MDSEQQLFNSNLIKRNKNGELTASSFQKLSKRRSTLRTKITKIYKSSKQSEYSNQNEFKRIVYELKEIENLLGRNKNSDSCDIKLQEIQTLMKIVPSDTQSKSNELPVHLATSTNNFGPTGLPVHLATSTNNSGPTGLPVHLATSTNNYGPTGLPVQLADLSGQIINPTTTIVTSQSPNLNYQSSLPINPNINSIQSYPQISIPLPSIPLSKFDGKVSSWIAFWTEFEMLVHVQPIPTVNKWMHLKSCLIDEAAQFMRNLAPTEQNYTDVISDLKLRYGSRIAQRTSFSNEIQKLQAVKSQYDIAGLRSLHSSALTIYRQAVSLGQPEQYINETLRLKIMERIPFEFKKDIFSLGEITFSEMLTRFNLLVTNNESALTLEQNTNIYKKVKYTNEPSFSTQHRKSVIVNTTQTFQRIKHPCIFCGSKEHINRDCPLSFEDKRKAFFSKRVCFICFQSEHHAKNCNKKIFKKCVKCKGQILHGNHYPFMCDIIRSTLSRKNNLSHNETLRTSISANQFQPRSNSIHSLTNDSERLAITGPVSSKNLVSPNVNSNVNVNSISLNLGSNEVQYMSLVALIKGEKVRIGFDSCSGKSFISDKLVHRLQLNISDTYNVGLTVFGNEKAHLFNAKKTTFYLTALNNNYNLKITARVTPLMKGMKWKQISSKEIELAKEKGIFIEDDENMPIELLIGLPEYQKKNSKWYRNSYQ